MKTTVQDTYGSADVRGESRSATGPLVEEGFELVKRGGGMCDHDSLSCEPGHRGERTRRSRTTRT